MVVGNKQLSRERVLKLKTVTDVIEYANELVPTYAKSIPGIIDNQVYLICLNMRDAGMEPLYTMSPITGSINSVYDLRDILTLGDTSLLEEFLKDGD